MDLEIDTIAKENQSRVINCLYRKQTFSFEEKISQQKFLKKKKAFKAKNMYYTLNFYQDIFSI